MGSAPKLRAVSGPKEQYLPSISLQAEEPNTVTLQLHFTNPWVRREAEERMPSTTNAAILRPSLYYNHEPANLRRPSCESLSLPLPLHSTNPVYHAHSSRMADLPYGLHWRTPGRYATRRWYGRLRPRTTGGSLGKEGPAAV